MLLGELSTFNNIHIFTPKHFLDLYIITKFLLKPLAHFALQLTLAPKKSTEVTITQ